MISTVENQPAAVAPEQSADFKNLIDLLAVYSEVNIRLAQIEVTANEETLEVVDEHKPEYAKLQEKLTQAEAALEILARKHPEWFAAKKSLKTPYGEVSLKTNPPRLVADNEELSIVLIETEGEKNQEFDSAPFIRQHKELNLETLASLTDEQLKKFRIRREQSDTFNVKPAKLDMGKAVKAAAKKTAKE